MKKIKLFTVVALSMSLLLTGCGSSKDAAGETSSPSTGTKTKVTIATINNFPPFNYKENGKLTGFDIKLAEKIAEVENLEIEWREMKFDGIIPALQAKQVDLAMACIGITDDRKKVVDFTESYFNAGYSLAVGKDSAIKSNEDLKDKTIVATQGTSGPQIAKELADKYGAKVRILQNSDSLYLDVETGNADALVIDYPAVAYKVRIDGDKSKLRLLGDRLFDEAIGMAVVKGKDDLVNKLNSGLKKLQDNGEYKKLYESYFGSEGK